MAPNLYSRLDEISRRPAPFERYTAAELWTDEHTSSRMLEHHLDASSDVSSRRAEFVDRSAAWIVRRFGLAGGRSVGDFGCGPGLYTTRLAAAGADVTGVDFSERSLRYARECARSSGLSIDYVCANYLDFASEKRFDLITLITCDFCALGPDQRRSLLDLFLAHLRPGGSILLDVYSLRAFEKREEGTQYAPNLLDGFWSAAPYYGFVHTFKYESEKVVLDKYTIVEKERVRTIYNWLQYFTVESLAAELGSRGFVVDEVLGNVAGDGLNPEAPEFAAVGRRPADWRQHLSRGQTEAAPGGLYVPPPGRQTAVRPPKPAVQPPKTAVQPREPAARGIGRADPVLLVDSHRGPSGEKTPLRSPVAVDGHHDLDSLPEPRPTLRGRLRCRLRKHQPIGGTPACPSTAHPYRLRRLSPLQYHDIPVALTR